MNILILSAETVKTGKGGVEQVAASLTEGFAAGGNGVFHLAWEKTAEEASVPAQFYFPKKSPLACAENAEFFEKFLHENAIDAVLFNWGIGKEYMFSEITRRLKVPVAALFHNDPDYYFFRYAKRFLWCIKKHHRMWRQARKYRWNLEHCDALVLLTEGFRAHLAHHLPESQKNSPKIRVIGNPTTFPAQKIDFSAKKKEVVFVGLDPVQKRPGLMFEIWTRVQDAHPDWQLKLLGGGENLKATREIAANFPLKRVSFEGWQKPAPYYRDASIFCMTSAYEGFPMALGEAARFACVPVVFDAFPSARDIVSDGENGIVVREGEIEKFAAELSRLMDDSAEREHLGACAARDVERFSLPAVCARWLDLFENLKKEIRETNRENDG